MVRKRVSWLAFALSLAAAAALFLSAVLPLPAQAAPSDPPVLVYDGDTKEFSVRNVDPDELFPTLDNLVPGDASTHSMQVQCQNVQKPVSLYVRPFCDKAVAELIAPVRLTAKLDGSVLYDGEIGPLLADDASPLKMVDFFEDGSVDLEVSLTIPVTLGNEAAGLNDAVRWTFTAQEEKSSDVSGGSGAASSDASSLTKTGDNSHLPAVGAVAVASCGVIVLALAMHRRRIDG
ncbi:hypothetical protein C1879_01490 [Paraeggerthella hongkongensis]|uniref:hypothetical protein n=1 Tax=Paraeggerthella sp. TaxID=2897350 RepID=UPI000DF79371|nr:hypothetical protein C1879_01490 [Paraeggerthella hongkongensis]